MEFRILGPLEVVRGDKCLAFRGTRERAVLALLVLHANRTVSAERLAEDLRRYLRSDVNPFSSKRVTYDLARQMPGSTEVSTSAFADAIIAGMA